MPFFTSNKFLPKKAPQRKINNFPKRKLEGENELQIEIDQIRLIAGDLSLAFDDGEWVPEGGTSGQRVKENHRLRQHVQQLESEVSFLRLKNEVLLDMLTETTAEAHLQDKELTRLRQHLILLKSKP